MKMKLVICFVAVCLLFCQVRAAIQTFSVATFDTGLYEPYVPLVSDRRAQVLDKIKTMNDDLICLQGLPLYEDHKVLVDYFQSKGYHSLAYYTATPSPRSTGACASYSGLGSLATCMNSTQCGPILQNITQTLQVFELFQCIQAPCAGALGTLNNDIYKICSTCISLMLPILGADALEYCRTETAKAWVSTYAVLMLSRYPFTSPSRSAFDGYPHGHITATVNVGGPVGSLRVSCATATGPVENYVTIGANPYATDAEDNAGQIGQLLIANSGTTANGHLILGNLATGPNSTTLSNTETTFAPIFANSYALFASHGFTSLYLDPRFSENITCTGCAANNLNTLSYHPLPDRVTSHILLKSSVTNDTSVSIKTSRFFTETITVSGNPSSISPEYGVRATVTWTSGVLAISASLLLMFVLVLALFAMWM